VDKFWKKRKSFIANNRMWRNGVWLSKGSSSVYKTSCFERRRQQLGSAKERRLYLLVQPSNNFQTTSRKLGSQRRIKTIGSWESSYNRWCSRWRGPARPWLPSNASAWNVRLHNAPLGATAVRWLDKENMWYGKYQNRNRRTPDMCSARSLCAFPHPPHPQHLDPLLVGYLVALNTPKPSPAISLQLCHFQRKT